MLRTVRHPATVLVALATALGTWAIPSAAMAATASGISPAERPPSGIAPTPVARRAVTSGVATVSGSGFGHGVGLSQYGALGMARAGNTAQQIVGHYYTGVAVTAVHDAVDLRVNVVHRGRSIVLRPVAIGEPAAHRARLIPTTGTTLLLAPGDLATVTPSSGAVTVAVRRGSGATITRSSTGWTVDWTGTSAWSGPATRLALTSRMLGGTAAKERSYRWGRLALSNLAGGLEAVTTVDLHAGYLRGLAEMPSSWPATALQAQVITARSYALVAATSAPRPSCGGCQLWDDQRSQMYVGWAKEGEKIGATDYGARWVAAVTATSPTPTTGIAVLYQGRPVQTYYASSTGGKTRDPKAVWGSSVPYLRVVADPWSLDPTVNPGYAAWKRSVTVARLTSAFGITDGSGIASISIATRDAAGAATTLKATSGAGQVRTLSGESFRSRLSLPSAWVSGVKLPG